jgi:hypothetical protein
MRGGAVGAHPSWFAVALLLLRRRRCRDARRRSRQDDPRHRRQAPGRRPRLSDEPIRALLEVCAHQARELAVHGRDAEIRTLLAGIQGEAPPKDIAALCAEGHKQNEAVNMALAALTVPLATLNEARSRRDAAIPDWEKHHRRLEDAAKHVYRDEAGRFAALFAEPDAVLTHTRPTTRKAKAKVLAAPESGQAAPAAKKRAKPKARRGR